MAMYDQFNRPDTVLARLKSSGSRLGASASQGINDFRAMPAKQQLGATLKGAGAPLAVGSAIGSAMDDNSTARYAERFGVSEPTGDGSLGDIAKFTALRAGGFASDLGNNLTLGLAGNLYADNKSPVSNVKKAPQPTATAPVAEDNSVQVLDGSGNLMGMQKPLTDGGIPVSGDKRTAPVADQFANVDKQRKTLADTLLSKDAGDGQTAFQAKEGYNPLEVNANAQDLVKQALESVNKIQNPADAPTLGDAFAQKIANRQITDKANTMAKTADQLNALATGSIGMRQGEQKLVQGDVAIDQDRQNLIKGDVDIQGGKQKLQAGKDEVDRSAKLKATLEEYANPKTTPERRRQLADLALTLQGKEPANRFGVESTVNADGTKSLYKVDKQTGEVTAVESQQATPQYQDGQLVTLPDGRVRKYNASTNSLDNP